MRQSGSNSAANQHPVNRATRSWSLTLQFNQALLRPELIYALSESRYLVGQAEADFEKAQQDLILRVCDAYFSIIVSNEVSQSYSTEISALSEQLEQMKRGYGLGVNSVTDIEDTLARVSLAKAKRISADNDVETSILNMEKISGVRVQAPRKIRDEVSVPPPVPEDRVYWVEKAKAYNPKIVGLKWSLDAAKENIKKNKSAYSPTVDLVGSYGKNSTDHSLTTPEDYATRAKSRYIGIQLSIPIYSGGGTSARVKEAVFSMKKTEADLEGGTRQVATDTQQAFSGVISGIAQIEALKIAVRSSEKSLLGSKVGYKAGLRINLDILNAQQQLAASKRDLAKARYDTIMQGLKLKAGAGNLSVHDVTEINRYLE